MFSLASYELYSTYHFFLSRYETTISKNRIIRKRCLLEHLKKVKYSGYLNGFVAMVLAIYLIENSVMLDTFIIDPFKYDAQEARGRVQRQYKKKFSNESS